MMTYVMVLFSFCLIGGLIGVASNPSPYYGVVGLVGSVVMGGVVLVMLGGSFISLVLFLIYLGGMLVVFAYSVSLASEPYPETWGEWSVVVYLMGYLLLVAIAGVILLELFCFEGFGLISVDGVGFYGDRVDFSGVSMLYSLGGFCLLVCGWGLLLTLFVVLELTSGLARGGIRVV